MNSFAMAAHVLLSRGIRFYFTLEGKDKSLSPTHGGNVLFDEKNRKEE